MRWQHKILLQQPVATSLPAIGQVQAARGQGGWVTRGGQQWVVAVHSTSWADFCACVLRNMAMARGGTDRQGVEYEHAQRRWVQEVVTRVRNDVETRSPRNRSNEVSRARHRIRFC
jgi:hypothetical protein